MQNVEYRIPNTEYRERGSGARLEVSEQATACRGRVWRARNPPRDQRFPGAAPFLLRATRSVGLAFLMYLGLLFVFPYDMIVVRDPRFDAGNIYR